MKHDANIRLAAINVAQQRAMPDASLDDILRDAKKAYEWMTDGPDDPPAPSAQAEHESGKAVKGQKPRA